MRGLALAVLLLAAARPAAAAPEARVDPRLELLGVVQRLAGLAAPPEDAAYAAQADAAFAAWRSHPVVALYGRLASAERDPLGVILLHYGVPPALALRDPESRVPYLEGEGGRELAQAFLWQLRDFAAASDFEGFFRAHRELYRRAEAAAAAELGPADPEPALRRYFGLDLSMKRRYALSLLYTPRAADSYIIPYPDAASLSALRGPFEVWTLFQWRGDASSAARRASDSWREPVFVVVEPLLWWSERLTSPDRLTFYGVRRAACRSATLDCVKDDLVEALLRRLGAPGPKRRPEDPDYPGLLAERLKEYEADRARYPTLWDFMPRLMSVYPEAAGSPARPVAPPPGLPRPASAAELFSPAFRLALEKR